MIVLLLFSFIDINIYSNKDTYLLGESIIVWWEIINTGDSVEHYQGSAISATNILMTEGEHLQFNDSTGREVPGDKISGIFITKSESGIPKIQMEEIKPGDMVKSSEEDLIGVFGSLKFIKSGGIGNKYIKAGEYFLSFFIYGATDRSKKIYSDTLHFFVKEPTGKEKEAWELYKDYMVEDIASVHEDKQMAYALEFLKKYPGSTYTESLLRNLGIVFDAYNCPSMKEGRDRMQGEARKVVDYLEKNVGKFDGKERVLKETVNCITHGELMLGTPKEEVRKKILQMNVPVSSEIKEVLDIKPEDLDTKKK
jgi:hypothetical protein